MADHDALSPPATRKDAPLEEDEGLLLARVERGERGALESLVERHQRAVFGYLRARLFEPADAEDLTQEVFLRSFTSLHRFERTGSLRAWLIGIARNLLREHLRRVRRRREVAWTELCLELDELGGHREEDGGELLFHLPVCLGSLSENARLAIDLHYKSKLRLVEIGRRLRRSEGAVKLLMFRARRALRHCLDRRSVDGSEGGAV
jgi:RNA polymerase sigma-70 factor (ECF subfamily)